MLTKAEALELIALDEEMKRRSRERRLFSYTPYPKQLEFHAAGKDSRERLLMAGNQLGKTLSASYEMAMHLTGRYPGPGEVFYPDTSVMREHDLAGKDVYPNGWPGHRFDRPIKVWIGSETAAATKETVQTLMIGPPETRALWGTGSIPREDLLVNRGEMDIAMMQGTPDTIDTVLVRHQSGGLSSCKFKQYSQGRRLWQGATLDVVWFDEEPPHDIYMEGLTRTNVTQGPIMLTFTPLLGMSNVVRMFLGDPDEELTPAEEPD